MTVYVVVADYGLNGAGILGVFATEVAAEAVAEGPHPYVTGGTQCTVEAWEVEG